MSLNMVKNNGKWQKGTSGNPTGRPRGSRNKAKVILESIFAGEAEEVGRRLIGLAKDGDPVALKIYFERIYPVPKDCPIELDVPPIESGEQVQPLMVALFAALFTGQLTLQEVKNVAEILLLQYQLWGIK